VPDQTKSIFELGGDVGFDPGPPENDSATGRHCTALCQTPLQDLSADDLAELLTHGIAVQHCVPLALDFLETRVPPASGRPFEDLRRLDD
jgi:hypothetical protein